MDLLEECFAFFKIFFKMSLLPYSPCIPPSLDPAYKSPQPPLNPLFVFAAEFIINEIGGCKIDIFKENISNKNIYI